MILPNLGVCSLIVLTITSLSCPTSVLIAFPYGKLLLV